MIDKTNYCFTGDKKIELTEKQQAVFADWFNPQPIYDHINNQPPTATSEELRSAALNHVVDNYDKYFKDVKTFAETFIEEPVQTFSITFVHDDVLLCIVLYLTENKLLSDTNVKTPEIYKYFDEQGILRVSVVSCNISATKRHLLRVHMPKQRSMDGGSCYTVTQYFQFKSWKSFLEEAKINKGDLVVVSHAIGLHDKSIKHDVLTFSSGEYHLRWLGYVGNRFHYDTKPLYITVQRGVLNNIEQECEKINKERKDNE